MDSFFAGPISDPLEREVADALAMRGIRFLHETTGQTDHLDFFLPDFGIHLEIKRFHSERISGQMARVPNVIAKAPMR